MPTILTYPSISNSAPTVFEFALLSNTQQFQSPLSGSVQTLEMPGARWKFSLSYQKMGDADSALWRSWAAKLRGRSGRFYMYNLARPIPQGVATGTPLVNGSSQTGFSLITDGWTPGVTGILKEGDFIGINNELKIITANANSNGSGQATLIFEPPLRSSPADNAVITTVRPTAIFKVDEDITRWTTTAPLYDAFSIAATEAW